MHVPASTLNVIFLVLLRNITATEHQDFLVNHDAMRIPCVDDDDCGLEALGNRCIRGLCTCSEITGCGQPKVRLAVTKIGEKCRRSSDCFIEKSVCDARGKCACKEGTIASENEKACLLAVTNLGEPCKEDKQCSSAITSTTCANGTCSCVSTMRAISGECFHMKRLGENCQRDEECFNVKRSVCSRRNKCTCVKKYIAGSSECLEVADGISSACTEDVQCTKSLGTGAECLGGFCDCKELYQYRFSSRKCVRDKMLGEECSDHQDCHQPGNESSRLECVLGECKCTASYYEIHGYCAEGGSSGNMKASFLITFPIIILCSF